MTEAVRNTELNEVAERLKPADIAPDVWGAVTALAFDGLPEDTMRETLLDANARIDSHAPLSFTHQAFDGSYISVISKHSLLEYRAKKETEAGNLLAGLFASSLCEFSRNRLLADVVEKAAEEEEFEIGRLAIKAMCDRDRVEDEDKIRAQEALNKAFHKQLQLEDE